MRALYNLSQRLFAHQRALALIAGAVSATGFRPLALWPLTLGCVALLIAMVARSARARDAALLGWLFGVGHFSAGNNWIATAFTYQAEMPAWLGWVAVVLLALYLAVYPALATLSAWWLARPGRTGRRWPLAVALAGCWIVAEWLRSWVFTGFAWNPLGIVALGGFERPGLAAVTPYLGTYALSGLIVGLAGCWWLAVELALARRWAAGAAAAFAPLLAMTVPWSGPGSEGPAGTMRLTLVQPDIPQDLLNDPATYEWQFQRSAAMSVPRASDVSEPGDLGETRERLVLWPESGVPDYLRTGYPAHYYRATTYRADPIAARSRIARVIGPDSLLLTGTVDLVIEGGRASAARNVVTAIGPDGAIVASYAKAHLVPYGEYLPMRALLEPIGLSRLVAGTLDFEAGPGPRTLDLGRWGRAGVQICYEIVFSGQVVDRTERPDYIVNPSNDGWFGSWGPPQHLAQARLRAIEEGLPVLRPTTTGISAVIDARGVVQQYAPMHRAMRIDTTVPPARPATLFARLGNALPLGWAAVLIALAVVASRRRRS